MYDTDGGIETVFEDFFLPIQPEQLKSDKILRKEGWWAKWPESEHDRLKSVDALEMEDFIKDIAEAAERILSPSVPSQFCRRWSSVFYKKAIANEKGEVQEMPDLVLLDKQLNDKNATWRDIISFMLVRDHDTYELACKTDLQIDQYAQRIFEAQPGRRFVLAISIIKDDLEVRIFDRSEPLVCLDTPNIRCESDLALRILLGTLFVDKQQLGFDPTLYRKDDTGGLYVKAEKVEYSVMCIYREDGMYGRGTVCYRGVSQADDSVVVIKDQWTSVSDENKEVEILEHLNQGGEESVCAPDSDGARVIPKVVAKELVKIKKPIFVDGQWVLSDVDDTTAIFCSSENEKSTIRAIGGL